MQTVSSNPDTGWELENTTGAQEQGISENNASDFFGPAAAEKLRADGAQEKHHGIPLFSFSNLLQAVERAGDYLISTQSAEGCWAFDLEADVTITAEYILLQKFLRRRIEPGRLQRLCSCILARQLEGGGWPLYSEDGAGDNSASVKAYFALKISGASPQAPHMQKARNFILASGGAAGVNVFTRITLALFGQVPWQTVPVMPVEIMLLPRWFFFHLHKISYWSRTVLVPLLILYAKRPVCRLKPGESIRELFPEGPAAQPPVSRHYGGSAKWQRRLFLMVDRILKTAEPLFPQSTRTRALQAAEKWVRARMRGAGGLGAIFPAMANAVMALQVLGYPENDPDYERGIKALDALILERGSEIMCQPCQSPVWDSCISLTAAAEANSPASGKSISSCAGWLLSQQVHIKSDWSLQAPGLEPGGWAFQFENELYPDTDDTPMVVMALVRAGALDNAKDREQISRAVRWVLGMQSSDGGWGSFDIDNNHVYLNNIPFADHGALLDPSTADVTARCVEMLGMLGCRPDFKPLARAIAFLKKEQEPWGGWYGRWGVNYIYGTWSVLSALRQAGEDMSQPYIRRAAAWLNSCQNPDRGWGETCFSYNDPNLAGRGASTASQTAWALLGLMAAGETNSAEVQSGIHYLIARQNAEGYWDEPHFTGTGFPKVFYLRYHGYCRYFPLWALSVYRRMRETGMTLQDELRKRSSAAPVYPFLQR